MICQNSYIGFVKSFIKFYDVLVQVWVFVCLFMCKCVCLIDYLWVCLFDTFIIFPMDRNNFSIYIRIQSYTCSQICIIISHTYTHLSTHIHTHTITRTHTQTHTHTNTHTLTYILTQTHTPWKMMPRSRQCPTVGILPFLTICASLADLARLLSAN